MRRLAAAPALAALIALALAANARAVEPPCELQPRTDCFGLRSVQAGLSTTQAGAHPDVTFSFVLKQDPESEANVSGFKHPYAAVRNTRFELPPGLVGEPNLLGLSQQCPLAELMKHLNAECPNGSQVGVTRVTPYGIPSIVEPVYMMVPPGGDVVARLGFIGGVFPILIDLRVRSESDYGLVAEIPDAPGASELVQVETTTWGVPADPAHDTERCLPAEVFGFNCIVSEARPPGSRPLPFMTNPTRCGVPLQLDVSAASWLKPTHFETASAPLPPITGCNRLPFGPELSIEPTSRHASTPTGLDVTLRLPAPSGVDVLEPSQMRDVRVTLPEGLATNPGSADGLDTCSAEEVRLGTREPSQCPDAAKIATTEFDIPALPRRMRGAFYLREPEPGDLFRIWIVADDLGAHVKLPGRLEVDRATGQITSIILDVPQVPLREARLLFKSGFRAPLVNPPTCGTHFSEWEIAPWSGTPPISERAPMTIDPQSCEGAGGFSPKLIAGTTDPAAGKHSPFLFNLTRQDGEQNPATLGIELPPGLSAKLAGVARCEEVAAASGQCPPDSRIGKVVAATGYGPAPLWVPQPDKRPTAIYLGGPYKGAPLSAIAVVPAQAGPFDLGDVVVRNAIHVDPETARATIASDPLPQIIEGIPIAYRTIHAILDRTDFTLNPTNCKRMAVGATVASTQGAIARPSSPFTAGNCAKLRFKPRIGLRLFGATKRGGHPKLRTVLRPRPGHANIRRLALALPRSEFLDQGHSKTVCTRVQFSAGHCPKGSIYGHAKAFTPLLDEPLEGPVYLRSSDNPLPDMVFDLKGPASLPIEVEAAARIDSVKGGIRATFPAIPDAPVSKVIVTMQGGKKGLFINSRNLCKGRPARASAKFRGQNGKKRNLRPVVRAQCGKKARRSAGEGAVPTGIRCAGEGGCGIASAGLSARMPGCAAAP